MTPMQCAAWEVLTPRLREATESLARVTLVPHGELRGDLVAVSGTLHGPRCEFARTLPAEYSVSTVPDPGHPADAATLAELVIADPCYWTRSLPFLYRLALELTWADGSKTQVEQDLGLRRLAATQGNLLWEQRRVVLRGAVVNGDTPNIVAAAREASAALLVENPTHELCAEANRLGVALVADLGQRGEEVISAARRLVWEPSVLVAVVAEGPDSTASLGGIAMAWAQTISKDDRPDQVLAPWARVAVVELDVDDRPPAMASGAAVPIIAVRRAPHYAAMAEARLACDALQAEFAPQFNLAGYFVTCR